MRAHILAILGLSLALTPIHAEEKAKTSSFPGLAVLPVSGGESPSSQQVSYDAALSKVINKPLYEKGAEEEGTPEIMRLLSTRLDRDGEGSYFIDFDPGPSADPSFIISDGKSGKKLGEIAADSLALPGNGFIYAAARSNYMHEMRQKFAIRDGKLVEIKQPFSYVGLDSKAKVPLALLAKQGSGEVVANIPAGDSLQVVLSEGDYLLIKTQFGLVGWWKMKTNVMPDDAEIEGIYYAGD